MKKLNLIFVILLFLISSFAYAATWENFKTEKIEIADGIYKEIKTYSSGKIEEAIIYACEQSGCNFMPTVQYFKDLDHALNHVMEESKSEDVFVLDTIADKLSGNLLKSNAKMISFITGPESGFSTNERKLMAQKKLSNFCLGHYILRAETAPLVALSKLHTLNGENV